MALSLQGETLELLEWPRLCQHLATFASTALGKVAALHLRIPTTQHQSETLLAQTGEIYTLEARVGSLPFEGIEDIGEALERAGRGGTLGGETLLAIATTLAGMRQLRRMIDGSSNSGENLPQLSQLMEDLRTYPELERQIHHCIDDRGKVADRASETLGQIRTQLKTLRDDIYQKLHRLMQRQGNAIQEQVITQRQGRFVIPVKAPQKDAIPGIVHDTSASGATLYIEPKMILESNNRLRQVQRQEQAEEERICRELSQGVAAVQEDLERLLAIATTLDLATARARYSGWLGGNAPRFIEVAQEPIALRHLRHPLLEWQYRQEQGSSGGAVVPIDLQIPPEIRVVAITGPNTGGKTVTLKTLGLAVLMAKVGLFIPAREPVELPWLQWVLADIGDEQSIQQSLSTFSGHIRRISRILLALGEESSRGVGVPPVLVLLDEVGAGTDPSEGSALALALLKTLADRAHLTLATTHFGELKALKYEDDRFENASVEFNDVTLSPTYRLLWGIPGRSNALAIAQRLGLDGEVIAAAQEHLLQGSTPEVNTVIAGLEAQRRRQEGKAQAAAQLLAQAEKLHRDVSRKAEQLKNRERELKQQQEEAIQTAIAQAKGEIAQVIRTLQQGTPTAQKAHQATATLEQVAQQCLPSRQPAAPPPKGFRPQVGDRVRVVNLGHVAEVVTAPDGQGEMLVRFGLMKMTVSLGDIESLQGEKPLMPEGKPGTKGDRHGDRASSRPPEKTEPTPSAAPAIRTSRNTLDLRGSRVADGEIELDRVLATADGPLWVIHGHGTGKLRQGVHGFLRQHPRVDRFEAADAADGGSGVTVVYPKLRP